MRTPLPTPLVPEQHVLLHKARPGSGVGKGELLAVSWGKLMGRRRWREGHSMGGGGGESVTSGSCIEWSSASYVCVCVRALHADVPSARSHSLQPGSCWRFASFPDEALLPPAAQAAVMARLP